MLHINIAYFRWLLGRCPSTMCQSGWLKPCELVIKTTCNYSLPSGEAHLKCVASSTCEPRASRYSAMAHDSATPSAVDVARPSSSISTRLRGPALQRQVLWTMLAHRVLGLLQAW
jgi:hypothetical protein